MTSVVVCPCLGAKLQFGYIGFSKDKVKIMDFSESIAACDLKGGTCRQLIELLAQGNLHLKIKISFSQIPLVHFEPKFVRKLSGTW